MVMRLEQIETEMLVTVPELSVTVAMEVEVLEIVSVVGDPK